MLSVKEVAEMLLELEEQEVRRLEERDAYARRQTDEGQVHLHTGLALAAQLGKVEYLKQVIAREAAAEEEPTKL